MAEATFDLIVVGGGPGGYVCAIRAAQLGMKTALVEREHLGGICLNWGCIPTKVLLRSSEIFHLLHRLEEFGLSAKELKFDLAKIVARSRKIADMHSKGVAGLLKKNKVTVFDGHGALAGGGKLRVTKDGKDVATLSAKHIILATGARARTLPGLELDVIGSGAIGIEFASFYRSLGAEVTVVEVLDRVLPVEDEDISAFARKSFEKQGMKIITGAAVKSLKKSANAVTAMVEQGGKSQEITAERVILAVGIVGNVEKVGLEGTKIKVEKTHVVVDEWLRTGEQGVYAIGDLVGAPWLAHKASHEGIICVEKIAGSNDVHPLDTAKIPGCTYCEPQVASIGLTEKAAKEKGRQVKVGKFPYLGNAKATAIGDREGLIKTVFDAKTGELLGAHMIGAEVTELIQGFSIAKALETTEGELIHAVFPHPTLSEAMHESVLAAYGRVIHI
jgi:dihydrolipoamide dehydrogenase